MVCCERTREVNGERHLPQVASTTYPVATAMDAAWYIGIRGDPFRHSGQYIDSSTPPVPSWCSAMNFSDWLTAHDVCGVSAWPA